MRAVLETHTRLLDSLIPEEDAVDEAMASGKDEKPDLQTTSGPEGVAPGRGVTQAEEPAEEPTESPGDREGEEAGAAPPEPTETAEEGMPVTPGPAESDTVLLELADDRDEEEETRSEGSEDTDPVDSESPDSEDDARKGDDVNDSTEEPPYAGV
jgi:hypothetical protein